MTTPDTLSATYKDNKESGLFAWRWRRAILDEAHELKTLKTKKTKAFAALHRQSTFLLTGTPVQNRVGEFSALLFLVTQRKEMKDYLQGRDAAVVETLRDLKERYFLRRTKADVEGIGGLTLPPSCAH